MSSLISVCVRASITYDRGSDPVRGSVSFAEEIVDTDNLRLRPGAFSLASNRGDGDLDSPSLEASEQLMSSSSSSSSLL